VVGVWGVLGCEKKKIELLKGRLLSSHSNFKVCSKTYIYIYIHTHTHTHTHKTNRNIIKSAKSSTNEIYKKNAYLEGESLFKKN